MTSALDQAREQMFLETISLAVSRSPFYADHLGSAAIGVRTLRDIDRLPYLSKSHLAAHALEMLTDDALPARVGISSGTTAGDGLNDDAVPAFLFQSSRELELLSALTQRLSASSDSDMALEVNNGSHGASQVASTGYFVLPLSKPYHVRAIEALLGMRFGPLRNKSIGTLLGPTNQLIQLAAVRKELDAKVARVVSFGTYLTPATRARLLQLAPTIHEIYGVSELPGASATRCRGCDYYHFSALVIPEIRQIIPECLSHGELVLTGLAPFQALQPMIRYRTGDIVEVSHTCPIDIGVRPIGRLAAAVNDAELALAAPSFLLREILEDLPGISRSELPGQRQLGIDVALGPPIYRLTKASDHDTTVLKVEIEVDDEYSNCRVLSFAATQERLGSITEHTRTRVDSGEWTFRIEVVPRGTIPLRQNGSKW